MKKLIISLIMFLSTAQYVPIRSLLTIKTLPAFIGQTIDGESVTQDIMSKGGVILFFRSTCGYCLLEYPTWIKMHEQFPDVPMVMVLHKQTAQSIKQFFHSHDNPFDYVREDSNNQLWDSFGARSTPESFIFDQQTKLIGHQGYIRGGTAVLEEKLRRIATYNQLNTEK